MIKIKYDVNLMKFISIFEAISNVKVKDAIWDSNSLIFVVEENQIAKAIGRHGVNVRKIESLIKKRVKIVEFSNKIEDFIRNYIAPIEISEIKNDNGKLTIKGNDVKTRSMLIGRDAKNLNLLKSILARYFEFKDVKVV